MLCCVDSLQYSITGPSVRCVLVLSKLGRISMIRNTMSLYKQRTELLTCSMRADKVLVHE